MNEEEKARAQAALIAAKFSVLDRMQAIGWIHGYRRDGDDAVFTTSEEGKAILHEIDRLFYHGGKLLTSTEMTAFCFIIKGVDQIQ